ncbi:MAG: hypothetical protein L3J53_01835 [Proteobacteria bacterium]|nr:hypothetical protein [Pseudomonadota bacterium]
MKKTYQLNLTENLHNHLVQVLEHKKSHIINARETVDTSKALLLKLKEKDQSQQVSESADKLAVMIEMLEDKTWNMRENNRNYALAVLSYFNDSKENIPASLPELGVLFDCMMIDIVAEELTHERDSYKDFKSFVKAYKTTPYFKGKDAEPSQNDWLKARKKELRDRLKRRRRRDSHRNGLRGSSFTIV